MVTQPLQETETKAFTVTARPNPNYGHRSEARGDPASVKCDHCRREGHRKDQCWFLHPHLRPKWHKKGGVSDRKGERGGWERNKGESEKKGFVAESEGRAAGRSEPSANIEAVAASSNPTDPMRQLLQQLTVMLNKKQENQKTSGMICITNLSCFSNNSRWILDSGATDHMTGNRNLLTSFKKNETKKFVTVANGDKMEIIGEGSIIIFKKIIPNVLYLKNCSSNLLSISKITNELNCELIFLTKNVIFQDRITKIMIGEGFLENGLYYLNENKFNLSTIKNEDLSILWHKRIGHPSDKILKSIFNFSKIDNSSCEICKLGKHTRLPFKLSNCKSKKPFDLVHSNVWGSAPINSFNGYKYFVLFIDDFSKTTWLYLLKDKSEVFSQFLDFYNFIENQYEAKIKIFRSDNGTEFVNQNFSHFFKEK